LRFPSISSDVGFSENEMTKSFIEICPGITPRTIANGKTMYQMIATLAAGSRMLDYRSEPHVAR